MKWKFQNEKSYKNSWNKNESTLIYTNLGKLHAHIVIFLWTIHFNSSGIIWNFVHMCVAMFRRRSESLFKMLTFCWIRLDFTYWKTKIIKKSKHFEFDLNRSQKNERKYVYICWKSFQLKKIQHLKSHTISTFYTCNLW